VVYCNDCGENEAGSSPTCGQVGTGPTAIDQNHLSGAKTIGVNMKLHPHIDSI